MKEGLTKSAVNELETSDWEVEHRLKALTLLEKLKEKEKQASQVVVINHGNTIRTTFIFKK